MTSATSCAPIANCATEVNDSIGTGCTACATNYYMTSVTSCALRPDNNCATYVADTIDEGCSVCATDYYLASD